MGLMDFYWGDGVLTFSGSGIVLMLAAVLGAVVLMAFLWFIVRNRR